MGQLRPPPNKNDDGGDHDNPCDVADFLKTLPAFDDFRTRRISRQLHRILLRRLLLSLLSLSLLSSSLSLVSCLLSLTSGSLCPPELLFDPLGPDLDFVLAASSSSASASSRGRRWRRLLPQSGSPH